MQSNFAHFHYTPANLSRFPLQTARTPYLRARDDLYSGDGRELEDPFLKKMESIVFYRGLVSVMSSHTHRGPF